MQPDPFNVRDHLLEAGLSANEVERMLRAGNPARMSAVGRAALRNALVALAEVVTAWIEAIDADPRPAMKAPSLWVRFKAWVRKLVRRSRGSASPTTRSRRDATRALQLLGQFK